MSVIKRCSKCGTWWQGTQGFHRRADTKGGFQSWCIVCVAALRAAYRVAPLVTAERLRELLIL